MHNFHAALLEHHPARDAFAQLECLAEMLRAVMACHHGQGCGRGVIFVQAAALGIHQRHRMGDQPPQHLLRIQHRRDLLDGREYRVSACLDALKQLRIVDGRGRQRRVCLAGGDIRFTEAPRRAGGSHAQRADHLVAANHRHHDQGAQPQFRQDLAHLPQRTFPEQALHVVDRERHPRFQHPLQGGNPAQRHHDTSRAKAGRRFGQHLRAGAILTEQGKGAVIRLQ